MSIPSINSAPNGTSGRQLSFSVAPPVVELGVNAIAARLTGLTNSIVQPEFEAYKQAELEKIRAAWKDRSYKEDPILQGYRVLHAKVGRGNKEYRSSPESLRKAFLERGRFPRINTLVDVYNLVSLRTGLALGAHDIGKIVGNVTLRLTTGTETFIPLGKSAPEPVSPNEYAYVDDGNNIICRLEVLQVEPTKTTENSRDVFLIIQGNEKTSREDLLAGSRELETLLTRFCGGTYSLLSPSVNLPH